MTGDNKINETSKRKVILVYPKLGASFIRRFPTSILCLAAYLERAGFSSIIIDLNIESDWKKIILSEGAEAICLGVSSLTGFQIRSGLEVTNFTKKHFADLPVVWGGVHPSLLPEQTLLEKNIDIIVRGEGEATLLELVNCLINKGPMDNVSGISYKKNGQIINNPDRPFLDINSLPDPAWHLIDFERYNFSDSVSDKTIMLQSSRGCPNRCTYCYNIEFNKKRWRAMSAERVLELVSNFKKIQKFDGISFSDDNFFVDFNRVKKICQLLIDNNLNIKWEADCRIDYLSRMDDDFFKLLKAAGLKGLFLGGESGSPRLLNLIKKDITVEQILASAAILKKHEIDGWYAFILGLPTETPDDVSLTIKVMKNLKKINPKVGCAIKVFSPFAGSPIYNLSKEYGFVPPDILLKWGNYSIEDNNTPWPKHKFIKYFATCTYFATEYDRLRNFIPGRFLKRIGDLVHLIEKFRWDHEFWRFPLELAVIKKIMKII